MGITQAQVRIPRDSLLPADDVINVWHFGHAAAELSEAETALVAQALVDFYVEPVSNLGDAVADYYASYMAFPAFQLRFYNVADPSPRAPYYESTSNLGHSPQSTSDLPGEIAACLSHRAPAVTGENPARRRSRLYLGPFNVGVLGTQENNRIPVKPDFRLTATDALARLVDQIGAVELGTYSRGVGTLSQGSTTETATADWTPFFVRSTTCWMDDAFDTQRSRGSAAAARTTVALV